MGGFQKVFVHILIGLFFWVSLPCRDAKAIAEGPEEVSSPEELKPKSLPGLRVIPAEAWPTVIPMQEWEQDSAAQGLSGISPGVTPGIMPYQVNPITAIMTASIVLAVQSLKEQGRIDHQALWRLLNNTDFYVGIIGSISAATGKKGGEVALSRILPSAFREFGKNQTLKLFGNIVNSLSYTIAVSAGFEYFSQYWKLATQNIPNVSKVSDLVNASNTDVIRVLNNLLQYFVNADLQKRIISSIKYHRVYTFEFLAMNVGLFVGVFVGDLIAQRIGAKATQAMRINWSQRLTREMGRFLGGVIGGVAIQFIPETFKLRVNADLMDWKIAGVRKDLAKIMQTIESGINQSDEKRRYPPKHIPGMASFVSSGVNLQSDVRRLIRTRDLLFSLYANRYFLVGMDDQFKAQVEAETQRLNDKMEVWIHQAGGIGPSSSTNALEIGIDVLSMEELEAWIYHDINKDEFQKHYTRVLYAGWQNLNSAYDDFQEFMESLQEFQNSEGEEILRDLQPIEAVNP